MAKKKNPTNPCVIIENLRNEKRFSYRDIAVALKYRVGFIADHTLLFRVANEHRECSENLARALAELWELEQ
jgi:hypothetical protein